MNVVLFDTPALRQHLLPFTFTRPASEMRVGILLIREKWEKALAVSCSHQTVPYLQPKFPTVLASDNLFINGALCPDEGVRRAILGLQPEQVLQQAGEVLAARSAAPHWTEATQGKSVEYPADVTLIDRPWKLFQTNAAQLKMDFQRLTNGRASHPITDPHTRVYGAENIFLEEGVDIKAAILNAEGSVIYFGKNTQVQEGAIIRGNHAFGEGVVVNVGAKMRGDTSIGPHCKIGGEVSNSILFGYSNKGHDGFLGNSVLGEWCNLGADTNTSNLKNNYEAVKLWSYAKGGFVSTGLQFCGLMMGDHSKCGINTMFNTGTVVGVGANIFGDGYPRNFVPSFAWGGAAGFTTFQLSKALETAEKVMERRGRRLTAMDRDILTEVFNMTAGYRVWEKKQPSTT
ncbi:MAG: GlmU family protein [Cyclobacteriaceae bacterium]|jgi:UDP-N-acetylglucosamine diphosphorylase/glucosamine-1-phosphate N-acetyltransferase|nr:GlmU family protein [Cyclobacteriaceae bacterium]